MRILFIGSTQGTACSLYYFTSFSRLGHSVIPFDPEYFQASNPLEKIAVRLRKGPTPKKVQRVSDRIVDICRRNRFDLVFVMAENFFSHATMEEIRKHVPNPPLFAFHSHDNVFSSGICKPADFEKTLRAYDFLFTTKSQNVARYKQLGQANAYFIPSAYEPSVHQPVPLSYSRCADRNLKVTFVGTYDHSRQPYLEAIGWENLHVWGNDWKRFPGYTAHADRIAAHAIYYFEFADVMSRSQCSLGLLREEAEDLHTQRTFEIPACGALQVAPRNEEILSFFREGEEIVCFASPEELRDKLNHYLANEGERSRIARKGHERCLKDHHTYQDRVSEMIGIIWRV